MTPPPGHEEPLRLSRSDGRVLVSLGKLTCVFPVPACSNATVLVPEAKTLPRAGFSHLPAQLGGLCPGQAGPRRLIPDSTPLAASRPAARLRPCPRQPALSLGTRRSHEVPPTACGDKPEPHLGPEVQRPLLARSSLLLCSGHGGPLTASPLHLFASCLAPITTSRSHGTFSARRPHHTKASDSTPPHGGCPLQEIQFPPALPPPLNKFSGSLCLSL